MTGTLVLVIEDNPKDSKLVGEVLRAKGYEIAHAATAEAGIELARSRKPDLVLMDVMLPGMDGREATKILKADAQTRHIPIIALTASAMKGEREKLLASGFDGYMPKPIDIKEVPKVVESYVSRRRET
jgi:two-component system cell cycle response regulator DivK